MLGVAILLVILQLFRVLILVFREDMLGVVFLSLYSVLGCLNPCFSGRYAGRGQVTWLVVSIEKCLNPCFSGRYAGRVKFTEDEKSELGLNPCFSGRYAGRKKNLTFFIMKIVS